MSLNLKKVAKKLWTSSPEELLDRLRRQKSVRVQTGVGKPGVGRCVWCLSTGRVGTETLSALSGLVPGVDARHEPEPLLYGLSRRAYESGTSDACQSILIEAVRACRPWVTTEGGPTYVETSPQATFLAPALYDAFPGSSFIHVLRHPGSVIRSGMRRSWYAGHSSDRWRLRPLEGEIRDQWERWDAFEKNVWLWAETNRRISKFMETLEESRCLVIKSEDLLAGDSEALEHWFGHIGAEVPTRARIQSVLKRKLNAQREGEFPRYEDWTEEQRTVLARHASPLMKEYGYEDRETR